MKKTKKRAQNKRKISVAPYLVGLVFVIIFSLFHLFNLGRSVFYQSTIANDEEVAPTIVPKYTYQSCTNDKKVSAETLNKDLTPEKIVIKKSKIDLNVVSVPLLKGTWKVFPKVANYAQGTSLINGKSGNVGIYAHDRADAFANIKNLMPGDEIEVYAAGHLIKYRVQLARVVEPVDVDVFFTTENPTLTLLTCEGNFSEQRYIVKAELVEINELNCNGQN